MICYTYSYLYVAALLLVGTYYMIHVFYAVVLFWFTIDGVDVARAQWASSIDYKCFDRTFPGIFLGFG